MKPTDPSSLPPIPHHAAATVAPERALPLFAGTMGLMLLGDFLLWPATPGLSWGLFVIVLGAALLVKHRRSASHRLPAVLFTLLLLTACQSAVEISFSNVLVSLALLVALVGELSYSSLPSGWERVSEAVWALAKVPGRWIWVSKAIENFAKANNGLLGTAVRWLQIGLPALILGAVFAGLFGAGNAIFGFWSSAVFAAFWRCLAELDLSIPHLLFYGILATFSLWVLRPADPGKEKRLWARTIPKLAVGNRAIAWWRSVLILGLLNSLFFFVNTIDALYLWTHGKIPAGVNASQYVHDGVNSLIAVSLLSAVVLTALFQQGDGIGRSLALKRLGYLWIAQNFVLIAGVILRLMRYIQDYLLTEQRVYAIAFVLLVTVGFGLLAAHIARNRTLNWLILSNGFATLSLFFLMQFPNVGGWVAHYNVTQWERAPQKSLDIDYLASLGAPAWPALARVAESGRYEAYEAAKQLKSIQAQELNERASRNWRSWQARRAFSTVLP